jgi:hypothetical protein
MACGAVLAEEAPALEDVATRMVEVLSPSRPPAAAKIANPPSIQTARGEDPVMGEDPAVPAAHRA